MNNEIKHFLKQLKTKQYETNNLTTLDIQPLQEHNHLYLFCRY